MTSAAGLEGVRHVHPSGVVALDGVTLSVAPGEHVAVVGPSGAGKTTLLRCLSGELHATEGCVTPAERPGIIFQDLLLVGRATVLQNVLHGAARRRESSAELKKEALAVLDRVGLRNRADFLVDQISGGERQRVAVARALMSRPSLILADEPVASLDPGSARAALAMLTEVCREGRIGLISVLHDQDLAERFADRVVRLRQGRLEAADSSGGGVAGPGETPAQAEAPVVKPAGSRWVWTAATVSLLGTALVWSGWMVGFHQVDWPDALRTTPRFLARLAPTPEQAGNIPWADLGRSLAATLAMAILGTALAWVFCLPMSAAAARNVAPEWLRVPIRGILNLIRSVPSILWALLAVGAFGLGPAPGVLALAAYSTGYLSKFFYEAFESVDPRTARALRTYGMSGFQAFRAAVWPAAQPAVLSSSLFMLEYNFRAAGVLGIVGAGGIGHDLRLAVEWANWHVVGVILAIMAVSVMAMDFASSRLRARLV
ncbi:MAG: phosphonate ABC transporter, permease protein PhnE [Fimbriimonadaceae bacterium]|nr:phosphonate ABC transporter, permease protein PhnE [Fimbriimonadaceae bacterium]